MVQILEFAVLVIVISASGVMSPGPLFVATISHGLREGTRAGFKIAIGHTIVELPLVILLGIGVFSLESFPEFRTIISIFGAITLFVFAAIQIRRIFVKKELVLSIKCIKSIFYYLVVSHWIQINFRCNVNVVICRHTNRICISYLDGFCMVRNSFISSIKKFKNSFQQKLQDSNGRIKCSVNLFWNNVFGRHITLTTI